jgi:hypothetical protein
MIKNIFKKIESKRKSNNLFWRILLSGKDLFWFLLFRIPQHLISVATKFYSNLHTRKVFENIYEKNIWGGEVGDFYSGVGSREEYIYTPYVEKMISELLNLNIVKPVIVDLGCGDFNVSKHLISYCGTYIGVDIVDGLIQKLNNSKFASDNVTFQTLDIIRKDLPDGDVVLIRQVLQHLSNAQIKKILAKLTKYKVAYITEHHPKYSDDIVPNKDKITGGGIRTGVNSGVYIDKKPFSLPHEQIHIILEIAVPDGVIRTYKYEIV